MIIFAKYGEYDRREFIEECLEKYLETAGKTKLNGDTVIDKNKNSKPYFKDYPDIRFSISHSADLVVLAMSESEVGVDIEKIKPRDYQGIVDRHFSEGENAEVSDLNGFLKVWTKKEAFLKLTSEGLAGLPNADVSKPYEYNGRALKFTSLDIFEGYIGAVVAYEQPIIFIKLN